jgi:hemolysin D
MQSENGAEAGNGAQQREPEAVFMARVGLDRTAILTGDQILRLKPGMAVTVEIDTGMRRIIDYLLSPLIRHTEESMTER